MSHPCTQCPIHAPHVASCTVDTRYTLRAQCHAVMRSSCKSVSCHICGPSRRVYVLQLFLRQSSFAAVVSTMAKTTKKIVIKAIMKKPSAEEKHGPPKPKEILSKDKSWAEDRSVNNKPAAECCSTRGRNNNYHFFSNVWADLPEHSKSMCNEAKQQKQTEIINALVEKGSTGK